MKIIKMLLFLVMSWSVDASAVTTTCPTTSEDFSWTFSPGGDVIIFTWHLDAIKMDRLNFRVVGNTIEVYLTGGSLGGPPIFVSSATGRLAAPPAGTYSIQIMPFVPVYGVPEPRVTCPDPFPIPLVVGGTGAVNVPVPAVSSWLLGVLATLLMAGAALGFWRRSRS